MSQGDTGIAGQYRETADMEATMKIRRRKPDLPGKRKSSSWLVFALASIE